MGEARIGSKRWLEERREREAAAIKRACEEGYTAADSFKMRACVQCKREFRLVFEDYTGDHPDTLQIRSCPSGGIYDVLIRCPHCGLEEAL